MAIALVGAAGAGATGSGTVSPTFGQATTAGNLLIACVGSNSVQPSTTASGWVLAFNRAGSTAGNLSIFYKPNCGASETAPTFTASSSTLTASLAEFSGAATASPVDQSGGNDGTVSPVVATAGGTDATTGSLVIAAGTSAYSMAATKTTSHTLNNGASATNLANNDATSSADHYRFAYGLTTGNGSADNTSYAFTTTNISFSLVAVTSFKVAGGAAAPVIPELVMARSGPY